MTLLGILLAISAVLQGWRANNRRHNVKYAPGQAAQSQIRQEQATEQEREALRRDAAKRKVRFR